jgi:hypothetical protein
MSFLKLPQPQRFFRYHGHSLFGHFDPMGSLGYLPWTLTIKILVFRKRGNFSATAGNVPQLRKFFR